MQEYGIRSSTLVHLAPSPPRSTQLRLAVRTRYVYTVDGERSRPTPNFGGVRDSVRPFRILPGHCVPRWVRIPRLGGRLRARRSPGGGCVTRVSPAGSWDGCRYPRHQASPGAGPPEEVWWCLLPSGSPSTGSALLGRHCGRKTTPGRAVAGRRSTPLISSPVIPSPGSEERLSTARSTHLSPLADGARASRTVPPRSVRDPLLWAGIGRRVDRTTSPRACRA